MAAVAAAWTALAKDAVALFGGLCLLVNVLLPAATLALQLAVYDAPELLGRWRTGRAQQAELERLRKRIKRLERRRNNTKRLGASDREDATQQVRRRRRRQTKRAEDSDSEHSEKSAVLSQAEAAVHPEAEERQRQLHPQRHRLSIYSTAKKPPRPQTASDTGSGK